MARKLRVEYPGAIYHVMNRGDRREPIFQDDRDRVCFLETLPQDGLRLCAFESGAGKDVAARFGPGLLSLGKPEVLPGTAAETARLAARGPVAGRAWHTGRQQRGTARVWQTNGAAANR